MNDRFESCLKFVLRWEGGYSDHSADPGGCTNLGVTIGTLRAWRRTSAVTCHDVRLLTQDEAHHIYAAKYWAPVWGERLPRGVDLVTFDWGVNSGPPRAIRELQRIVGAVPDRVMGPKTLAAVQALANERDGAECIVRSMTAERQAFYRRLRTWPSFGRGWTNRNNACKRAALKMLAP